MKFKISNGVVGSVGVLGAALGWLLSFKILAYYVGPEGVGLFSQLRQLVQTSTLIVTYGGTNVLVQVLTSQDGEVAKTRYRAAALKIFSLTGLVLILTVLAFAPQLTNLVLATNSSEEVEAIRWLALAVLLSSVATFYLAILNSYYSFFYMAIAQCSGPLLLAGLLWAKPTEIKAVSEFYALALILCFGLCCIIGGLGVFRLRLAKIHLGCIIPIKITSELYFFALSNLLAVISSSIVLLIIRAWVIEDKGLEFAGLFDAGWTLTFNYTTLLLTACNSFYLPALTAAKGFKQQMECMLKVSYAVLGISILVCYLMIVLQQEIIHLFYSPRFEASGKALAVLAIAVMLRGVSWVYGTYLIATRQTKVLLFSDLALNLSFLVTVKYALDFHPSLEALGWAFVLPHFLYLIFIVEYVRHNNPLMLRRRILPYLLIAVIPLLFMVVMPTAPLLLSLDQLSAITLLMGLLWCVVIYRAFKEVAVWKN